jgi:hypothetical protein
MPSVIGAHGEEILEVLALSRDVDVTGKPELVTKVPVLNVHSIKELN